MLGMSRRLRAPAPPPKARLPSLINPPPEEHRRATADDRRRLKASLSILSAGADRVCCLYRVPPTEIRARGGPATELLEALRHLPELADNEEQRQRARLAARGEIFEVRVGAFVRTGGARRHRKPRVFVLRSAVEAWWQQTLLDSAVVHRFESAVFEGCIGGLFCFNVRNTCSLQTVKSPAESHMHEWVEEMKAFSQSRVVLYPLSRIEPSVFL